MKVLAECSKKVMASQMEAQVGAQIGANSQEKPCRCSSISLAYILFGSLTIGLLWQIHGMSLHYLTGGAPNVVIETKLDNTYVKIPALTFCTNIGDITHGITSGQFFEQVKVTDIVDSIQITSNFGGPKENFTFLIENPIETISYKYYCFTINSQLNGYTLDLNKNQQIWIKLKSFGIYNSWWIFMHNSYDVPSSYEWNAIEVKKGQYVPITYTHEVYEQIEYTLPGNCFDYKQHSEHNSRRDCIRKCKLESSVDKCGVVYNGVDVNKLYESVKFVGTQEERKCVTDLVESGDDCQRRCHNSDCRTEWYTPSLIAKYPNHYNYTLVELIPPTKPEFVYKQRPLLDSKLSFYLMSGNISLWLGFAFYLLYKMLSKCSVSKKVGVAYNKVAHFKTKTSEGSKMPM